MTVENDEQLKVQVEYLFSEINMITNDRNCMVIDFLLTNDRLARDGMIVPVAGSVSQRNARRKGACTISTFITGSSD